MFIEQAAVPQNRFWKYGVGLVIVILGAFVGQIPFTVAVFARSMKDGGVPTDTNQLLGLLEPNLSLFLMLLSFVAMLAALYIVVVYLHRQSFRSLTTGRPKVDWKRIAFSFCLWGSLTAVTLGLDYFLLSPQDYVWNFQPIPFMIMLAIGVLMIPLQTSAEEYLFRGYLMQGVGILAGNRWVPLVVTSVLFGLLHISNPEVAKMGLIMMVYYIGTGLFLGIITLMDDGLELALGFHAANNLMGALLVTSDWSAFQTYSVLKDISQPEPMTFVVVPVVFIYPVILIVFAKRYGWKNWVGRLTKKFNQNGNPISQTDAGQSGL